jgi:Tfp pilus assembly protein PilO
MKWSELQPQVRVAILVAGFLFVALLVWSYFAGPMLQSRSDAQAQLAQVEGQLEAAEREVEGVVPPSDAERAAWQGSQDELISRLGPESELPLLLESLTRLAEAQNVEVFVTSGASTGVAAAANNAAAGLARQVFAAGPGSRSVELNVRGYGQYDTISRFISQTGRLGWVVEIASVAMTRSFPEVVADVRLVVFFRADTAGAETAAAGSQQFAPVTRGARGGGGNG